ncbi:MAG: DUF4286 family protein [Gemmatimonadaceae bacterium]|nr:DUF4286 family protein [Gemmatimonadaceae bacterium]
MITYEITSQVRSDLTEAYEAYMRNRHIDDVLGTGYFASASFSRSTEGRYRIRYYAFDQAALDTYLKERAAELRKHFSEQFPEGVELTRENWAVIQYWPTKGA